MNGKKFGFGLVGCGLISSFHANAINNSERMELISVTDINQERALKIANEFDCEIQTFDEMLANPHIDIINILTPNAQHYEFTIKAAEAKKHILIEKPPEMSLEKVDKMIKACSQKGVKAAVVLQCRFRKAIEAMKQAVDEGRFGKIVYASAYMKWFRSQDYYFSDNWRSIREQGAGVTIQQAFHYIDLLLYLAGNVKRVYSIMKNLSHPKVQIEDTVQSFFEFQNGASGSLEASTSCYPGTDIRIEIFGENGLAIMKGDKIDEWKFRDEKSKDKEIKQIGIHGGPTASSGAAAFQFYEHMYLFEDFIDSIIQNKEPRVTLSEGRRTLELALAMYNSAEKNKWISI